MSNLTDFIGGSGSGLDADKLDGLDSTAFAKIQGNNTKTFKVANAVNDDEAVSKNQLTNSNFGFKNYIINGGFDIWQRGTYWTGLANATYTADRWVVYDAVGDIKYDFIRNAGKFDGGYGAQYTWKSGTGMRSVVQFIENVTQFKVGEKVTVSFDAYTDSDLYSINVATQCLVDTWDSTTPEILSSPIALSNTKTRYSVTLTIPDWTSLNFDYAYLENTKLALKFDMGPSTNGKNFVFSNVQLEKGSVATPFEQRPYGLEMSLCQRYYKKITVGGRVDHIDWTFDATTDFARMRTYPTATLNNSNVFSSNLNYDSYGNVKILHDKIALRINKTNGGTDEACEAYLGFDLDAEL